tara:strand:+ start:235 stop:609 length:375 start_codon:yes stop_codon:yes gene_type:complete
MKGIFKVVDKVVHIEEFAYPLNEFLKDEPDFSTPKKARLIYKQGESINKDSGYSSKILDQYIARKNLYRAAYKARRNGRFDAEKAQTQESFETKKIDEVVKEETTLEEVTESPKKSKSKKQKGE